MNLQEIITESINSVLFRKIISEEILRETSRAARGRYNSGARRNGNAPKGRNLQQQRQQNRQQTQNQNTAPQNPQQPAPQNPQQPTQQPSPKTPQNQQQPAQQPVPQTPQGQQQTSTNYTQYANQLSRLVGSSGIDSSPVQNNQQAVEHIQRLNEFVFEVINAIENGNILSSNTPTNGASSTYGNPYNKGKSEYAMDASKNVINYLGNGAENIIGYGNNNPFKGVFKAGVDTYNQDHNAVANMMANKRIKDARNGNRSGGGGAGTPTLAYLMTNTSNECYPRLQTEYQQLNTNGIFGATPNVSNCYAILQNVAVEVTREMNSQRNNTQANQSGQGTTTNAPNTPGGVTPGGGTPSGQGTTPNAPNTPGGGTPSGGGTGTGTARGTNTGGAAGTGAAGTTPGGVTPGGGTPGGGGGAGTGSGQQATTGTQTGGSGQQATTSQTSLQQQQQPNNLPDFNRYINGLKRLDNNGEEFANAVDMLEHSNVSVNNANEEKIKKYIISTVKRIAELSENCINSMEKNDPEELVYYLSANYDSRFNPSFCFAKIWDDYNKINQARKNLLKNIPVINNTMAILTKLRLEMFSWNTKNNKKVTRRF